MLIGTPDTIDLHQLSNFVHVRRFERTADNSIIYKQLFFELLTYINYNKTWMWGLFMLSTRKVLQNACM